MMEGHNLQSTSTTEELEGQPPCATPHGRSRRVALACFYHAHVRHSHLPPSQTRLHPSTVQCLY